MWADLRGAVADLSGSSPEHRSLYGRLAALAVAVVAADAIGSISVYLVERASNPDGHLHPFWNAVVWTTSQLLTGGASLGVTSQYSHIIELLLELLDITAVAALAGSLGAFFHRRDLERYPLRSSGHTLGGSV